MATPGEYDTTDADGYYQPGKLPGGGDLADGPDGESWEHAFFVSGGGEVRGKIEGAMKACNPDGLKAKAKAWDTAAGHVDGYETSISGIYSKVSSAWSGDDADQALKIINGLYATIRHQAQNAHNMHNALDNMGTNLHNCKEAWGHDTSTGGGLVNWAVGNQDRESANDYKNLMTTFKNDMGILPHSVPTQVKTINTPSVPTVDTKPTHAGVNGAPSVGGAGSSPHVSNPTPAHIQQPTWHNQNPPVPPVDPHPPVDPVDPTPPFDPTHPIHATPISGHSPGGVSPYDGGGAGIGVPGGGGGLDTGGSLAGFDPSGGGAGLGAGGGLGSGAGAGGAGLNGLGAGSGLGAGAGAGGAGAGAGAGAGGTGAGGAGMVGGRGMMGGGQGGDEDERERSTWLTEDEDVWGAEDEVPGVIS